MIDATASAKFSQNTDNIEQCSFYSKISETAFSSPYTLYRVKHNRQTKMVNAGGMMVQKIREVFRLYSTDLEQAASPNVPPVPKVKDKIVDSSDRTWIVIEDVEIINQGQQFICYCQKSTS